MDGWRRLIKDWDWETTEDAEMCTEWIDKNETDGLKMLCGRGTAGEGSDDDDDDEARGWSSRRVVKKSRVGQYWRAFCATCDRLDRRVSRVQSCEGLVKMLCGR